MNSPTFDREPATPSILNTLNHVPIGINEADCINVDHRSTNELGKMLSPLFPISVSTIFGTIGTIKNFMDFIAIPGYPREILALKKFGPKEIKSIPKTRIAVPNYWAIVAYAICQRVKTNVKLISMIKKNTLPYTSYEKLEPGMFFDKEVLMSTPNIKMGRYLAIIRHIEKMIKADNFNDDAILKFIMDCRDDTSKDIFDNMAINVVVKDVAQPSK